MWVRGAPEPGQGFLERRGRHCGNLATLAFFDFAPLERDHTRLLLISGEPSVMVLVEVRGLHVRTSPKR
jgi:hypothetical protein